MAIKSEGFMLPVCCIQLLNLITEEVKYKRRWRSKIRARATSSAVSDLSRRAEVHNRRSEGDSTYSNPTFLDIIDS